jgi:uncharacterized phage protein (predicted DNA packaging)
MNININKLKAQLNIELDYLDDDAILQHLLNVATLGVQTYLGTNALTGYTSTNTPVTIEQAVIMLAAHYYINRNIVSYAQGTEVPLSFKWLLDPYRDYIVG